MDALAKSPGSDHSLADVLGALASHEDVRVVLDYGDGRQVQPGYHVTEVKAGSFVTLDCGSNPDAWRETILQVEDVAADEGQQPMEVDKFLRILAAVDRKVQLDRAARLTFEISRRDEAMRIYDVAAIETESGAAVIRLAERPAICKPRHRAMQAQADPCCGPATVNSCC